MLYIVNLMSPSMTTFLVLRLYSSLSAQAIWISSGIALYHPGWVSLMSPPTRKKSVNLSELSSHSTPSGMVGWYRLLYLKDIVSLLIDGVV